jgi:hypothetical protein
MATKDQLIKGIEVLIQEGRRLADDLTPEQWEKVVDLDGWKNREVLAHVAGIGGIVVPLANGLASAPAGVDPVGGMNIDDINAGIVTARAAKSAKELADELEAAYRGVIDFVRNAPDDLLAKHATAGGHKDVPLGDILMRMVILHGFGHIYSVYSGIFTSKD